MTKIAKLKEMQSEILLRCRLVIELKRLRALYGITQAQFAKHLHKSIHTVKKYEKPDAFVTSKKLLYLIEEIKKLHKSKDFTTQKVELNTIDDLFKHVIELIDMAIQNIMFFPDTGLTEGKQVNNLMQARELILDARYPSVVTRNNITFNG